MKVMRGERLEVLQEKMWILGLDKQESYKFLEVEHEDDIKTKEVYKIVKVEVQRSIKLLSELDFNDILDFNFRFLHVQLVWKPSQLQPTHWMAGNLQKDNWMNYTK